MTVKHLRDGIHDHHRAACRTDAERQRIDQSPLHADNVHFDDERCWVFFEQMDATGNPHPLDNERDPLNRGRCSRCRDLGCRCDALGWPATSEED